VPTTRSDVLAFIRGHLLAVQASVSGAHAPQAAVVGFIITDDFEVFFDSVDSTRKVSNLRQNPRIALVIGGLLDGDERTVQYEGVADEPEGHALERLKEQYFERFPDGRNRQQWPGLTYVRARPRWLRFSNFNQNPPEIVELVFES
jgi:general stress protein 26